MITIKRLAEEMREYECFETEEAKGSYDALRRLLLLSIPVNELNTLSFLASDGGDVDTQDVAEWFGWRRPYAATVLKRLVDYGLARRDKVKGENNCLKYVYRHYRPVRGY